VVVAGAVGPLACARVVPHAVALTTQLQWPVPVRSADAHHGNFPRETDRLEMECTCLPARVRLARTESRRSEARWTMPEARSGVGC
jgi:hypothetical protein